VIAMSESRTSRPASRRVGYVVTVLVDAAVLVVINVAPGWQSIGFVTPSFAEVLALVNLSVWLPLLGNVAFVAYDPRWLVDAGQTLFSVVTVGASVRLLEVFPFDFSAYSHDWSAALRVLLWLGVIGGLVSVVVSAAHLVRDVGARPVTR
jgi:hypothetical protein